VSSHGTDITMRGRRNASGLRARRTSARSRASVASKSAIAPSRIGRTSTIDSGRRAIIASASRPNARASWVRRSRATTAGSEKISPVRWLYTRTCSEPRSTPRSAENMRRSDRSRGAWVIASLRRLTAPNRAASVPVHLEVAAVTQVRARSARGR
jgi:hypothetical protein